MNEATSGNGSYIMPIRPLDIFILASIWSGSVLGIVLNLFVMVLSVTSKEISGTYMYYIFNLASLDFSQRGHMDRHWILFDILLVSIEE